MYYAIAFILGYLVAKAKKKDKHIEQVNYINKDNMKVTEKDFDKLKDALDHVILDLDDLQGRL